jgi:glucose/arabinose dehydrogenase
MRRSFLGIGLFFAAATFAGCAGGPGSTPAASTPAASASQPQSASAAQPIRTLALEPSAASAYQRAVLKTKPLAYFPLNSPKQGSVKNIFSVTLVNGATLAKKGPIETDKRNRYLSMSGTQYATTSLSGGISGTGSMVAWVNLSELPSTAGQYFYVSGETQSGNDFDLQFQNDNNLYFYTGQGENTEYTPDPSTLVGKWNMIAVTYDGGSAQTRDI